MFFEKGFVDAVRNDLRYLLQIKKIVLRIWYENRQIMEEKNFLFLSLILRKGYILSLDIPIISLFGLIRHCINIYSKAHCRSLYLFMNSFVAILIIMKRK